jgi:tetratricopeptide (TPR) repeat protein
MMDDLRIEAHFTLEERVGRGASGDVHRAVDRETGAPVAVKRLLPVHEDAAALERFRREARLLALVDDPHVVRYVAHGVDAEGRPCLVVEWLEGEDLARRKKREPLRAMDALEIARQAALGLHALHHVGVVHRDVKPANLFLVPGEDGRVVVKLIDLGVARSAGEATLTQVGMAIGTPFYMSPEQARGEERVTHHADQFSLGVTIFELIAGRRPFTGDDYFAVLAKIVLQDPPRLRDVVPGVPPTLDALVRRMMSRDPMDRFASMREVADAIAAIGPWEPAAAPAQAVGEAPTTRMALSISATIEQRVVTALFAFAPLGLDDRDQAALAGVAEAQGAACHPTLGGRMIAVFGGDRTLGDEAVRAARAALAASARLPLVRFAIVTGRTLAGTSGLAGDLLERGAAEVERDPVRGAVRVDEATARLVGEHFLVDQVADGRVITGARPEGAPQRMLVGKPTPCVGRDRELGNLEAMYAECAGEPVARAAVVIGPAGIGKSRLRYELCARLARADPRPLVVLARPSPLPEASAFGLLAPALRRLAGILDGEPAAAQHEKLALRFGRLVPEPTLARIADLAGLPPRDGAPAGLFSSGAPGGQAALCPGPRRDAMLTGDLLRAAWIAWLTAECAEHPVALVLEDLQWGDLPSVEFVGAALRAMEDRPLLVVALGRPEITERFPSLWASLGAQELRLGPLLPKASERLVRAALGARVDDALVQRIVARAEGNAFYVEELIRAAADGAAEALPDSVLGMVQARLDVLGNETKRVLRAASVFGTVFWRGGAAALLGETRATVGEPLARLTSAEIVSRRPAASFPDEEEYVFRHALVREAAYAMVPDADRPVAHRLAGTWLERAGAVEPAVLAAHFERSDEPARAARFHLRAAEKALAGNDFAGAITHAKRSVDCSSVGRRPAEPGSAPHPRDAREEERGAALLIQAEAHRWRGELAPAALAGAEAAELLPRGGAAWFHAVRETIAANGRLGHFDLVRVWADEAIACEAALTATGAAGARIACLVPAAGHCLYAGESAESARLIAAIDAIVADAGALDPMVNARLHQLRALRADQTGDLEGALAQHEAALACYEQAGDVRGACLTLSNLGSMRAALGAFPEAEEALRRALASAERMGLTTVAPLARHNLGGVLGVLGRLDDARTVESQAIEAFRAVGDPRLEGASRVYLSRILLAMGDVAGAEAEARAVAESSASPAPLRAGAFAALAEALRAAGRVEEALTDASDAARVLASLESIEDFEALIGRAHAEALWAAGRQEEARTAIGAAAGRLLARAARLGDAVRARFLGAVPDNARIMALARDWGVTPAARG